VYVGDGHFDNGGSSVEWRRISIAPNTISHSVALCQDFRSLSLCKSIRFYPGLLTQINIVKLLNRKISLIVFSGLKLFYINYSGFVISYRFNEFKYLINKLEFPYQHIYVKYSIPLKCI